jgi:recombinational DNA repair ATPase RecF
MDKITKQKKNSNSENIESDNVDTIRDILFGSQMRSFEQKFSQLEERLSNDFSVLRQENARQFESLQTFIEGEIDILSNKLSSEEKIRIDEMDGLDNELKQTAKHIDKKIIDTGNLLDKQSREINQKILKQSQAFTSELNTQVEQTRKRIDEYNQDLSDDKLDKSTLAEIFNTLALQINGDNSK